MFKRERGGIIVEYSKVDWTFYKDPHSWWGCQSNR